jgi:5,5'-dehydrodivanillate O-demethylase oxygenase subunit
VPVDRITTRFMLYTVHAPSGVEYPSQAQVPDYQIPVYDERGRHRVDYVEGQDMMAWVTQGPITDRTVEHLGRSDIGVTMLRRMFKEQMTRVSRGEDALGVIRHRHDRIDLPCEKNKFDAGASFAIDFIDRASSRFRPQADALKKLHIRAHENRKAATG